MRKLLVKKAHSRSYVTDEQGILSLFWPLSCGWRPYRPSLARAPLPVGHHELHAQTQVSEPYGFATKEEQCMSTDPGRP